MADVVRHKDYLAEVLQYDLEGNAMHRSARVSRLVAIVCRLIGVKFCAGQLFAGICADAL